MKGLKRLNFSFAQEQQLHFLINVTSYINFLFNIFTRYILQRQKRDCHAYDIITKTKTNLFKKSLLTVNYEYLDLS